MTTRKPTLEYLINGNAADRMRELLEDFDVIGTMQHLALLRRDSNLTQLRQNVRAALVASTLHLASIDYVKRRYCSAEREGPEPEKTAHAYIGAYHCTRNYVRRMLAKLQPDGLPEPSAGVFTASVALERLPASFFSAHFLYRLGYRFEGHAVSRLILEQIAWAYAAHTLDDVNAIEKIEATQCISQLKKFAPEVGQLYGFLSTKTHVDFSSHLEFLSIEDDRNVVWHAYPRFRESAEVIMMLGDLFGMVWELSQFAYIKNPEAVELREGKVCAKADRPFLAQKGKHLSLIAELSNHELNLQQNSAQPPRGPLA